MTGSFRERAKSIMYSPARHPAGTAGYILYAASRLYGLGMRARNFGYESGFIRTRKLLCRVISVGNITLGGTGKTPLARLIAGLAPDHVKVGIVSRGYGSRAEKSGEVQIVSDGQRLIAEPPPVTADEAWLLAKSLPKSPVICSPDRYAAGKIAQEQFGVDVVILDDGFQHRALHRDLDIVSIDCQEFVGNGHLFPRGILREPLESLRRAGMIVLHNSDTVSDERRLSIRNTLREILPPPMPVVSIGYAPDGVFDGGSGQIVLSDRLLGQKLLGFAGIAKPENFERVLNSFLKRSGDDAVPVEHFNDHHQFTPDDVARLVQRAKQTGAKGFITTEKDFARLTALMPLPKPVYVLTARLRFFEGETIFKSLVLREMHA